MFCDLIIYGFPEIINFLKKLKLDFYYTKPQIKHLQGFIIAMMLFGYHGKISNVSELALNVSRTSIGRFINKDKDKRNFDDSHILRKMQEQVIKEIWNKSKETGLPIYVIIDDTICEKTVPSSKVEEPIEGCGFHKSHLENKTVYGHQFVVAMLKCGELVLQYDVVLYEKEKGEEYSKIKIAKRIIESLPKTIKKGYVMSDSWYSCQEIFETAKEKGFEYIGAIKTNRVVYPRGYKKGIQVGTYARILRLRDFDLVTINGNEYLTYTYLGKINGLKRVKIVISYPRKAMYVARALKVFLSTDIKMTAWQLLKHYSKRWKVEVFFRESNRRLGMKECQIHSLSGVKRLQYIIMLCHNFCSLEGEKEGRGFSKQRKIYQKQIQKYQITWIYEKAQKKVSLEYILKEFHIA